MIDRFRLAVALVLAGATVLGPAPAAAQEPAILLDRQLAGRLGPAGQFAHYRFGYAADGSTVTVNLQVTPENPAVLENVGFLVYGRDGRLLVRGGAQPGLRPNVSADLRTSDAAVRGTATIQVYNYDPHTPIDYTIWLTGAGAQEAAPPRPAPAAAPPAASPPASCEFRLGFAALAAQIPEIVGRCLENEQANRATGETTQRTTNGLLVWRATDNATGFTDGYRTWVSGPLGLQTRLNSERFPWEEPPPAPRPVPVPTLSFSVDDGSVAAGQCTTVRWRVADAGAVYLLGVGADDTPLPAAGERPVCPAGTTTYTLRVVDLAGQPSSHPVDVVVAGHVAPRISFSADRTAVALGECTTLRWDVADVRAVYLRTPDEYAGVVGQGARGVCPRTSSTYSLDVVDLGGATTTHGITVAVQGGVSPRVSFWADRTRVAPNECATLHWDVADVRAVHLRTTTGSHPVERRGERLVCPPTSYTYMLDVVDLDGVTLPRAVAVAVHGHPAPSVLFWAERREIEAGECTTVRWSVADVREAYFRTPDGVSGVIEEGDRRVCPRERSTYSLDVVNFAGTTTFYPVTVDVRT